MKGQKDGKMDKRADGRVEEWKEWKDGRLKMDEWNDEKIERWADKKMDG